MMRSAIGLAALGLILATTPAWADCPLDLGHGTGWVVFSQHYMIAFRPDPPHVEAGTDLALVLNVCTKRGDAAELVAVEVHAIDASSSERRDPPASESLRLSIVPGVDGRYRAEGLLLAKPGRWEVDFDVRSGGDIERLTHEIVAN
jgi:hypothetical protein